MLEEKKKYEEKHVIITKNSFITQHISHVKCFGMYNEREMPPLIVSAYVRAFFLFPTFVRLSAAGTNLAKMEPLPHFFLN